jgi:hypothetical protein
VAATNVLRKVPILIEANRSVKTWSEQMLAVLDAGAELRMIKHEIGSSSSVLDPPFPNGEAIINQLVAMDRYTNWVAEDFSIYKKELSELQRRAEEKGLTEDERERRQGEVWDAIRAVPSVQDMTGDSDTPRRPAEAPSWAAYQGAEEVALRLITEASLGRPKAAPQRTAADTG